MARLMHEMKDLADKPAEGITVTFNEDNLADISAEVEGPGFFVTKIFHPNIRYTTGEICVNTLKRDWQPTHGIRHVLMVVRCLLIEPFPESALNEEAAKMLLEEYDEYFRRARMMTSIHARNDRKGQAATAAATEGGEAGAAALGNATNFMSVRADENDDGRAPAGNGEPPLKKLDRKKSLKRL